MPVDLAAAAVSAGELATADDGTAVLRRAMDSGRYRLDVFDMDGSAASSQRFYAGWWSSARQPQVPDELELNLERADLRHGDRLRAFVRAPFAGKALVTVVNDALRYSTAIDLAPAGSEITVPVDRACSRIPSSRCPGEMTSRFETRASAGTA